MFIRFLNLKEQEIKKEWEKEHFRMEKVMEK